MQFALTSERRAGSRSRCASIPPERSAVSSTEAVLHRAGLTYATADHLVAEGVALAAPREAVANASRLSRQRVHTIARRTAEH